MLKTDAKNGKPGYGSAPAFPFVLQFPNPLNPREIQVQVHPGLTVRDYFAAKALATCQNSWDGSTPDNCRDVAEWCYRIADAMLHARERNPDHKGFPYEDGQH